MNQKKKINEIEEIKTDKIIDVCLRVTKNNNCPALEIRKLLTDYELIRMVIASAFLEKPLIIYPKFTNKFLAINTLIENGIIYKKGEDYFFTL